MPLSQLLYVSRRSGDLDLARLEKIVARSAVRNSERKITGVLLCWGVNLMQLLEGEAKDVLALFETIRLDPRHAGVRCLMQKNVRRRLFPDWGMKLTSPESASVVDHDRLARLLADVNARLNTSDHGVEARLLLNDFLQQLECAA